VSFWNCLYLNSGLKVHARYEPAENKAIWVYFSSWRSPTAAEIAEGRAVLDAIMSWKGLPVIDLPAAEPPAGEA
jgi:hypothetical protein